MQLKKYDVILCKGNKSIVSKIIEKVTKNKYSHAELFLGNYLIVDGMPNGVKIRPMDRSLGKFDAYRYKGEITSEQEKLIEEYIQKRLNCKYNFKELILQLFNKQDKDKTKVICITLVTEAFQYAGIDVGEWQVGFGQICDNEIFAKVNN